MSEPNWLGKETIQAIHSLSLSRFGGDDGLRDAHALESVLDRPLQHFRYSSPAPSLFELAALYGSGLVTSHPFIGGNKRTGFIAALSPKEVAGQLGLCSKTVLSRVPACS
jgi:death-on-curing protein